MVYKTARINRPVRAIDLTPKGLWNSSEMRKRARDSTLPASRSSSETLLCDSTFTARATHLCSSSDGSLHPTSESAAFGYYPSGGLGLVLTIVLTSDIDRIARPARLIRSS